LSLPPAPALEPPALKVSVEAGAVNVVEGVNAAVGALSAVTVWIAVLVCARLLVTVSVTG
jgi:hypothetical protein